MTGPAGEIQSAAGVANLAHDPVVRAQLGAAWTGSLAVSQSYDRSRPTYPEAAIDRIKEFAGFDPGAKPNPKVLEVGCGTGIATATLNLCGFDVDAQDISPESITVAKQKNTAFQQEFPLAGHGTVNYSVASLEDHKFTNGLYDVVVAAQSIHWVSPEARWTLPHAALKDGGTIACMSNFPNTEIGEGYTHQKSAQDSYDRYSTTYVTGGDTYHDPWNARQIKAREGSQREIQVNELYREYCPTYPLEYGSLDIIDAELTASGLFAATVRREFDHVSIVNPKTYVDFQSSLSWVKALEKSDPNAHEELLGKIAALAGDDPVVVPWVTQVVMARKLANGQ